MPKYLEKLCQCTANYGVKADELCKERCPSNKGIYTFYEGEKALYVGRSDRVTSRINEHGDGKIGKRSSKAALAVILAKEKLLRKNCSEHKHTPMKDIWNLKEFQDLKYGKVKGRKDFKNFFNEAQLRIHKMRVGVVEIEDPNEQSIFEVYAHLELDTPYNSFRNH